jgi:hypothetical protein
VAEAKPGAGTVTRYEGGAQELERRGDTSTALLAAQAEAMVKARFFIAIQRPRDWDDVRTKLLRACERPGFAGSATEKTWGAAWFRKPVGEGVEGFSIRFAEEALRAMGNIDVETTPIYEDDSKRVLRVTVLDLESNVSMPTSITVSKTIIRKFLKKGQEALRTMVNSRQETTYLVEASEDEVFQKQQVLASKAIRNGVLRLLPGDIQAECRERILAIRHGEAAKDPDGFRKKVVDGFAKLNVLPSDIKKFLGHDLAKASPEQLTGLRDIWQQIGEGKTTWVAVMEAVAEERGEQPPDPEKKKPGLEGLTKKLKETGKACSHPKVPPSKVAALKPGKSIVCEDCGEELKPEAKGQRRLDE